MASPGPRHASEAASARRRNDPATKSPGAAARAIELRMRARRLPPRPRPSDAAARSPAGGGGGSEANCGSRGCRVDEDGEAERNASEAAAAAERPDAQSSHADSMAQRRARLQRRTDRRSCRAGRLTAAMPKARQSGCPSLRKRRQGVRTSQGLPNRHRKRGGTATASRGAHGCRQRRQKRRPRPTLHAALGGAAGRRASQPRVRLWQSLTLRIVALRPWRAAKTDEVVLPGRKPRTRRPPAPGGPHPSVSAQPLPLRNRLPPPATPAAGRRSSSYGTHPVHRGPRGGRHAAAQRARQRRRRPSRKDRPVPRPKLALQTEAETGRRYLAGS